MSDKIVNVYVGECFQDGGQVGGDGKTYGLSLTGNKLKLVENGTSKEVDLPASGGGSAELPKETKDKLDELSKYGYIIKALGATIPNENELYSDRINNVLMYVSGTGDIDRPYALTFIGIGSYYREAPYILLTPKNSAGEDITQHPDFSRMVYDGQVFTVMGQEVTYHENNHSLDISKLPIGVSSFTLLNT